MSSILRLLTIASAKLRRERGLRLGMMDVREERNVLACEAEEVGAGKGPDHKGEKGTDYVTRAKCVSFRQGGDRGETHMLQR